MQHLCRIISDLITVWTSYPLVGLTIVTTLASASVISSTIVRLFSSTQHGGVRNSLLRYSQSEQDKAMGVRRRADALYTAFVIYRCEALNARPLTRCKMSTGKCLLYALVTSYIGWQTGTFRHAVQTCYCIASPVHFSVRVSRYGALGLAKTSTTSWKCSLV